MNAKQVKIYAGSDTYEKWRAICHGFSSNTAAFAVVVENYFNQIQEDTMDTLEVSVNSKKWGWGYSTQPVQTPTGLTVECPDQPDYTGTVAQVKEAIRKDRAYNSLGGAYHCDRWFYDGRKVAAFEWWFANDPEADPGGPGHWGFTTDLHGFDPDDMALMGDTFKIKVL